MVWHQDAKRCFIPTGEASPTLSVATTEIYKPELVPLTLAQAQNAFLQTHSVGSLQGPHCKTAMALARGKKSHCAISMAGADRLESICTFPGSPASGDDGSLRSHKWHVEGEHQLTIHRHFQYEPSNECGRGEIQNKLSGASCGGESTCGTPCHKKQWMLSCVV